MSSSTSNTSASLLHLCGRKHKSKMGSNLNESVATRPNAFARAQLEKLGWTEGTGLGKNRDGRSEHIRVTKRKDNVGIGISAAASTAMEIDPVVTGDQWWKSSVGNTLERLRLAAANKKAKKSKKKDKNNKDKSDVKKKKKKKSDKKRKLEYTEEELFEATGGARFGMRAQTQQKGKWNRAEDGITKDEEAAARQNTEWDGKSAPKIVLSESKSKKKEKKSTTKEEDHDELQPPKKKKRKITAVAIASDNDNDDDDDNSKVKKDKKKKDKKKSSKKSKKKQSEQVE